MIEITDKTKCTGCNACFNICPLQCIDMQVDGEGFRYPIVDTEKCNECGICEQVCPILFKKVVQNSPSAYACINKDNNIRMQSSSGGVFSLLAEEVLAHNGVVFGAGFDNSFNVVHAWINSCEKLSRLRGSKYVQSDIGITFKETKNFLKQGKQVLFSGTPCQIAGLKAYLGKEHTSLICVDIICHGVPSPKVWRKYIDYRQVKAGAITQRISFRRKDDGWKRYSVLFSFKNNTEYRETLDKDLYMRAFLKDVCLRPSCYNCEFKTIHRQSDITLADFWGIKNILPDMDDDKGTSLIFVNSKAGQAMFEQITYKMQIKEVDINEAVRYNSSAIKSVAFNPNREKFLEELNNMTFDELVKKYCTDKLSLRIIYKIKLLARSMLEKMGLLDLVKKILGRN